MVRCVGEREEVSFWRMRSSRGFFEDGGVVGVVVALEGEVVDMVRRMWVWVAWRMVERMVRWRSMGLCVENSGDLVSGPQVKVLCLAWG